MKIRSLLLTGLCVASFLSFGVQAQNSTPPKKIPQLTTDDFDNRTAAPVSSSTPVAPNDGSVATTLGKKPGAPSQLNSATGARTVVDSAWDKTANLKSGRVEITYQPASGAGARILCEFAGSDRMRLVKEDGEVIFIAGVRYAKARGQEWKQFPANEGNKTPELSFKTLVKSFTGTPLEVQLMGEERLNQMPMLKLKLTDKHRDSAYAWIGKDDGFLYQIEGTASSSGGYVKMIFSDHNAAISILPPVQ